MLTGMIVITSITSITGITGITGIGLYFGPFTVISRFIPTTLYYDGLQVLRFILPVKDSGIDGLNDPFHNVILIEEKDLPL